MVKTLNELANSYRCDKGDNAGYWHSHGYTHIYEKYLEPQRNDEITLFEIGVWLEVSPSGGGESLNMWKDYFPNGKFFAFDINESCKKFNSDRIKVYIGDQGKKEDLIDAVKSFEVKEGFDVILEDGSHRDDHQQITLSTLFQYVKPGGLYILEDMLIDNPTYIYPSRESETHKLLQTFKSTSEMPTNDIITSEVAKYITDNTESIEIYPDIIKRWSTAIFRKKK